MFQRHKSMQLMTFRYFRAWSTKTVLVTTSINVEGRKSFGSRGTGARDMEIEEADREVRASGT